MNQFEIKSLKNSLEIIENHYKVLGNCIEFEESYKLRLFELLYESKECMNDLIEFLEYN